MAFYEPTVLEFHVLLVDHNTKNLVETCKLLQLNLYKVTPVQDASVASLMLREGNSKFDLVMVDEYSFNMRGFNIIEDATKLDLPVAIMSSNANAMLAKRAIEEGAFLIMEKPIIVEDFKYLWQNVLRENVQKHNENQGRGKTCIDNQNYPQTEKLIDKNTTTTDMIPLNTGGSSKNKGKKVRNENSSNLESNNNTRGQCMKPKLCTEWTQELHEKFMAAVKQLGDGKCFPKEILEIMNVPGLTRMQVASHLQKCRYGPQRPERQTRGSKVSKSANNTNSKRSNSRRYGSFPSLIKGFKSNQNDEQGLNSNMEYLTPSNNMGQDGIFENLSNNNFMIDQNALDLGLQSDVLYGFASADNDGLIQNNFNFQGSDSDQVVSTQTSEAANQVDPSFWTAWIANLASDDLENGKA